MQQAHTSSNGATAIDNDAGRVMLVIESTIGGTRLNLRILVEELVSCGKTVLIAYSACREKAFLDDVALFRSLGVECAEIPMRRAPAPASDLRAIFSLRRLIRKFRPDVLHLISSKAGLVGRLAAIGTDVKVQYAPHCFAFKSDAPLRIFYAAAEWLLAPLTDRLVAVCRSEADDARRIGYPDRKISIVPNRLPDGYVPRQRAPVANARPVASFIGRSARQKGIDILLDAYRLIGGNDGCGFELLVMSDVSPRTKRAFETLGAKVLQYGTHDDAMELLSRCDVLVMPSRWEAAPYLLLEARAAGVFIVANDVGGVRELLGDYDRAIVYHGTRPQDLADAMRKAQRLERLKKNCTPKTD